MHNGGSTRGYQELLAPLANPATTEQACGQTVYLCSAALGATARFCRRWCRSGGRMPTLLWPGRDDDRGGRLVGRLNRKAENLAAVQAVARPQPCGPGADHGVDQVFAVLVGSVADTRWLTG